VAARSTKSYGDDPFRCRFGSFERRADATATLDRNPVTAYQSISGKFGRDHQNGHPGRGQLAHEAVNLRLCPNIDPLRRFVRDQNRWFCRQPSGQGDLLLIPPESVETLCVEGICPQAQTFGIEGGELTLPCLVEQTRLVRRGRTARAIENDRELLYDTVATSILWNIGDTGLDRVSRRVDQALSAPSIQIEPGVN
jgi:hypothetical protein